MLSRVAESLYWMSRYIERAENAARFLAVNDYLSLDFPDGVDLWKPLMEATGDKSDFDAHYSAANPENVAAFLSRDRNNPNSIVSSVEAARENARSVRDFLTLEMGESPVDQHLQNPPDGDFVGHEMGDVVDETTSRLKVADLKAIILYLRSLPPVFHRIERKKK